jgi:PLP dependent protein
MSREGLRERYERLRDEIGPGVRVVVATKYVSTDEMAELAEAGVEVVGENRLQDLVAKQERWDDRFEWHFIGQLQSRKAREVSARCTLVHSLDSLSAARRLDIPALVEVNLSGEGSKAGVATGDLAAFLAEAGEAGADIRGLMTMPPFTEDPERSRPYFRELRELVRQHGLTELSMGTSQDYLIAVDEGATLVRVGSNLLRG